MKLRIKVHVSCFLYKLQQSADYDTIAMNKESNIYLTSDVSSLYHVPWVRVSFFDDTVHVRVEMSKCNAMIQHMHKNDMSTVVGVGDVCPLLASMVLMVVVLTCKNK